MTPLSGVKQKCFQLNPLRAAKSVQYTLCPTRGEVDPNLLAGEHKHRPTHIYTVTHTHTSFISQAFS